MNRFSYRRVCGWAGVVLLCGFAAAEFNPAFPPPHWQSTICFPDDPDKTLVDDQGTLLYHYTGREDFRTKVRFEVDEAGPRTRQTMLSPRIPVVSTEREAGGLRVTEETFAAPGRVRNDVVLARIENAAKEAKTVHARVVVESRFPLAVIDKNRVQINSREVVYATGPCTVSVDEKDGWKRAVIEFAPMALAAGKSGQAAWVYSSGSKAGDGPASVPAAAHALGEAKAYWNRAALPYGRIAVPDPAIQGLLDAAVRNIWQSREIKKGLPAFQVGPTCYRGLWIVDGSFLLEAATLLGAGSEARAGIDYMLSFQQEDGRFEILKRYHKENGIVLWACVRHAQLMRDRAWLESKWPQLLKAARYIQKLRADTLQDASPLDDGLMPPGSVDGGIGGEDNYEYSNVYWNLTGLKALVGAAQWLGKAEDAQAWQREYDDFYARFRAAAQRDTRSDLQGNRYLPILMSIEEKTVMSPNAQWYIPDKGQWAFCHGVYPGQLFAQNDPLVTGNLAMLKTYEKEDMVVSTGWMTGGIWNYFGSFYGHAWLWQGEGAKAAQCLHAMAQHASPLLAWREEQALQGEPYRKVGDMPHNWASAEFIRLAIHLLELDRGKELHLLEGLPEAWAKPGMRTALNGVATPFGPLSLSLQIDAAGKEARLKVGKLAGDCDKVVVHLGAWAGAQAGTTLELAPGKTTDRVINLAK